MSATDRADAAGVPLPADESAALDRYRLLCHQQANFHARRLGLRQGHRDDLLQVAFLGVVLAYRKYDPSRGASLFSFTHTYVSGYLRRAAHDIRSDGFSGCTNVWDCARLPRVVSGSRPAESVVDAASLLDMVPAVESPADGTDDADWRAAARAAGLSWREKATLDLARSGFTQRETAGVFGVSRSRAFQHQQVAARKLADCPAAAVALGFAHAEAV